ncbi:MAG: hypothetical protein KC486_03475 [Myxococcales bacterium]|nr:hypothetical protein [Myxococcales bacterium]
MDARAGLTTSAPQRSTFVTVVAWIFIVFSGMATLISALQNLLLQGGALARGDGPGFGPDASVTLIFAAFFVGSAVTLAASIGLLRRRAWARPLFIAMLVLFIVAQLGGLALQYATLAAFEDVAAPDDFTRMVAMIQVFSLIFAVALCGGFVWIIRRLLDPEVRAEFG